MLCSICLCSWWKLSINSSSYAQSVSFMFIVFISCLLYSFYAQSFFYPYCIHFMPNLFLLCSLYLFYAQSVYLMLIVFILCSIYSCFRLYGHSLILLCILLMSFWWKSLSINILFYTQFVFLEGNLLLKNVKIHMWLFVKESDNLRWRLLLRWSVLHNTWCLYADEVLLLKIFFDVQLTSQRKDQAQSQYCCHHQNLLVHSSQSCNHSPANKNTW